MDQLSNKNESPPFKLPEVQVDTEEVSQSYESAAKNVNETAAAKAIERNTNANPLSNSGTLPTANPVMLDPAAFGVPTASSASATPTKITVTDDLQAHDNELIEKAWVVKAKAIVAETKSDPYEQSNEIKKIRNDYLSKRFKANVKIDKE